MKMKRTTLRSVLATVLTLAVATIFISCDKKKEVTPDKPDSPDKHWLVAYRDIMLGDQNNTTIGHFLKTQTGEVLTISEAFKQQGYMSMMYFSEYGNNYKFLTFPGNAYSEGTRKEDEENNFFTRATVGLNYWNAADMNSGEIFLAATMEKDMNKAEFDALATSLNWNDFDKKFKEYNSGKADLSGYGSVGPENGAVYMLQLNNTVRAFIYIKNLIPGGASGGSVKFDMVIEGMEGYTTNSEARKIQPAKD